MAELRYNPITRDWLMVASHRQERPQMPKNWCPFCVGSGKVPDEGFDVFRYPNDFPALSVTPPTPDDVADGLFEAKPAYGRCEVLLYADKHEVSLSQLADEHVHKLSRMWKEVYTDFARDPEIKYIFIFENRGDVVGVTMPHPHGQVYGYPFVPKNLRDELEGSKAHFDKTGKCLFCELLTQEIKDGRRIIYDNEHFTLYMPFFAQTAYATHITAKRHVANIAQMTDAELDALGEIVRDTSAMYDALFNTHFPYMMCMHNAPPSGESDEFFHFHIEFIPPMRSAEKQQFFASSETGAGAWCNPTCPEEKAAELREAIRGRGSCFIA
ncbi:MAG: galactose-1-phosphate uridylyltransferase [Oscillospiraceae bacterium]|nr:galactose-1-phosphate uridylyltransferase [Oscillospiraceae bacterium]MCL2280200.1 galactose-1-phosphate uridylyltransferase [Oscillospiraceae bacterium]